MKSKKKSSKSKSKTKNKKKTGSKPNKSSLKVNYSPTATEEALTYALDTKLMESVQLPPLDSLTISQLSGEYEKAMKIIVDLKVSPTSPDRIMDKAVDLISKAYSFIMRLFK